MGARDVHDLGNGKVAIPGFTGSFKVSLSDITIQLCMGFIL